MIKALIVILIGISLTSFAPVPAQACTWETAPARLSQQIVDPIGYPFGHVSAWSCDGDTQAVIAELADRASAMQAEAAAYRQAHPIEGAP